MENKKILTARKAKVKLEIVGCLWSVFQLRSYAVTVFGVVSSRLERYREMRRLAPREASFFTWCAYPRAAAVPTCLYIPIQLNKACFLFSALAPMLPAIPFLAARLWTRISATPNRGSFMAFASQRTLINYAAKIKIIIETTKTICIFF